MLLLVDEGDRVADVLLEADLPVFGLLAESGLIFANEGLLVVMLAL